MKHFFLLIIAYFVAANTYCQGTLNTVWEKRVKSPIGGNAEAWGVDCDESGNVYWPVSYDTVIGNAFDIICYKFNQSGVKQWVQPAFIGGLGTQQSYIVNANDTVLYVGGRNCASLLNSCDMMVAKIKADNASVSWLKTYDYFGGYDETDAIEIDATGIYTGGWASKTANAWDSEMGLWKLSFQGNTEYVNTWGELSTAEHIDGHFVVDGQNIFAAGLYKGAGIANMYEGKSILAKFDKFTGSLIDTVTFGSQGWWINWDNALGMTSDGNNLFLTGVCTPTNANHQIFLACFDKNLNQKWISYWGGSGTEGARALAANNGYIYVAGSTDSPEYTSGNYDIVLLKYDSLGNNIFYKTWGGYFDDNAHDVAIFENSIFISGITENSVYYSNDSTPSALLIKSNLLALDNDFFSHENYSVSLYPNPVTIKSYLKISLGEPQNVTCSLVDILGVKQKDIVLNKWVSNTEEYELDFSGLPKGTYFVKVTTSLFNVAVKAVFISN